MSEKEEPQGSDTIDFENFENPFFTGDGGVATDEAIAAKEETIRIGGSKVEPESPEEPEEPEEQDVSGDEEEAAEDKQEAPEAKSDDLGLGKIFGTEDKKKQNKGLREQLKDRNNTVSDLQAQIEERETRLEELKQQYADLQKERDEARHANTARFNVGDYDEKMDPEVELVNRELGTRLKQAEINLGTDDGRKFSSNFETLLLGYQNAINGHNQESFLEAIDQHFPNNAADVKRELSDLNRVVSKREEVVSRNRTNHYSSVIGSYEEQRKRVDQVVSEVGVRNPNVEPGKQLEVNNIIGLAAEGDATYASEVDQVKRAVVALTGGIRPFDIRDDKWRPYLDPSDPTKLTEKGMSIRQAEVDNWEKARQALPRRLAESWAASLLVPRLVSKLSELMARLAEDQEDEAVEPVVGESGGGPKSSTSITEEMLDNLDSLNHNPHFAEMGIR